MNGFKRICAVIFGAVLFVAGVLKLMDPVGTALKVGEYLVFFHIGFLRGVAGAIGVALALAESLLGGMAITGIWRRFTGIASGILMGVFTVITLILWIANPAMDCGCFGEVLPLTHAQSFLKNVALIAFWALAFLPLRGDTEPQRIKYVSFSIAAISVVLFALYSLLSIPLQDFTSLRPGVSLVGAPDSGFGDATAYVFEKDGKQGAFDSETAMPDSSWTFVREQPYNLGIVPAADPEPLSFYGADGAYADSLATAGPVAILSVYNPEKLSEKKQQKMAEFASRASEAGFTVLVLCAGTPESISGSISLPSLLSNTYFADRKTLLTLNRSNGGLTLLADAQIIAKFASRALPAPGELQRFLSSDPVEYMMDATGKGRVKLQGFLLYTFAVMILL